MTPQQQLELVTERIYKLHAAHEIYEQCEHNHEPTDKDVVECVDVGFVCKDGFLYLICTLCCTNEDEEQTEECVSTHKHSSDAPYAPRCATVAALVVDDSAPEEAE
jgi:hypothetical protein